MLSLFMELRKSLVQVVSSTSDLSHLMPFSKEPKPLSYLTFQSQMNPTASKLSATWLPVWSWASSWASILVTSGPVLWDHEAMESKLRDSCRQSQALAFWTIPPPPSLQVEYLICISVNMHMYMNIKYAYLSHMENSSARTFGQVSPTPLPPHLPPTESYYWANLTAVLQVPVSVP